MKSMLSDYKKILKSITRYQSAIGGKKKIELSNEECREVVGCDLSSYDLDEQDQEGNTVLHLLTNDILESTSLMIALLKGGANPVILNKKKQDFMQIFLNEITTNDKYRNGMDLGMSDWGRNCLFFMYQILQASYQETSMLNRLLNTMASYINNDYISRMLSVINKDMLSESSLKVIINWLDKLMDPIQQKYYPFVYREVLQKQNELKKHLHYSKKYPSIYDCINELMNQPEDKRNTIHRAMYCSTSPLFFILRSIGENENVLSGLPESLYQAFVKFMREYEQYRVILEKMQAIPNPLTKSEQIYINNLVIKLESAYKDPEMQKCEQDYRLNFAERFKKSVEQYDLEDRYTNYKNDIDPQYRRVMSELKEVSANKAVSFFGDAGKLAKHKMRMQSLQKAEARRFDLKK